MKTETQTMKHILVEANAHLVNMRELLVDEQEHYSETVSSASDDELTDLEEILARRREMLKRAEARVASLTKQLAQAEKDDRATAGNAALEQSQAVIAEMQGLMDSASELSERAVEISVRISALTAQASEHRRMAAHYGVKVEYAPRLTPPDLAMVHAAYSRIVGAGGYLWRPM